MTTNFLEEINYYGFAKFNSLLSNEDIKFFKEDILKKDVEILK